MGKRYLNVNGKEKLLQELTYNDLIELFWNYIKNNNSFPSWNDCKSINNLPTGTIITNILEQNNLSRIDFYLQFGDYASKYTKNLITISKPWMIKYIKGGYEKAKQYNIKSNKKITFKCPCCGHEFDRSVVYVSTYGFHCQCCDDGISYPNKFSYELLNQLSNMYNIKNIQHEYSPSWSGRYRYDNYFEYEDSKYILEMDGGFHKNNIHTKSSYTLEQRVKSDKIKNNLALTHNICVIRIDCEPSTFENIKHNLLNSELSKIFNLSDVDWDKCNMFAMNNVIKAVCEYFKFNSHLTTGDLSRKFGLYATTIAKYLKIGTKLGWCIYNPILEKRKYQPIKYGHTIDIFDDKTNQHYKFESIIQAEKCSKNIFNKFLSHSSISKYVDTGIKYKGLLINSA